MTRPSKMEQFLDKCERVAKKLGRVVKAFAWIEKVYKNEMVKALFARIWAML